MLLNSTPQQGTKHKIHLTTKRCKIIKKKNEKLNKINLHLHTSALSQIAYVGDAIKKKVML